MHAASLHLFPGCLPNANANGIGLPETGNMINISIGVPRHKFEELPDALKSDDAHAVAEYFRNNFVAFELEDYEDFGRQWAEQRWNLTGQVHCNFYHSNECGIVLMGDAAHATSPSLGMGMNTALRDAQFFYNLIREHKDNLADVLPEYSRLRVKEGNSLTHLSMNAYCFDAKAQFIETLHMLIRTKLNVFFPSIISPHPQSIIGSSKFTLAQVYQHAHSLGVIPKLRRINDETRQSFFERECGMIDEKNPLFNDNRRMIIGLSICVGIVVSAVFMVGRT